MLRAIVGLEIPVSRLVGKWKLSQNRSPGDRKGVLEGMLDEGGDEATALAAWMRPLVGL
jgi:transcriptional regulator